MKHYLWVSLQTNRPSSILLKLYKKQIDVMDVSFSGNRLLFRVWEEDYKRIQKLGSFQVVGDYGIYKVFPFLRKKGLIVFGLVLFFVFSFLMTHLIVDVKVIHSSLQIRNLVTKALDDYGIKPFTWRKNFDEIEKIKEQILDQHPDTLEWISISLEGMRYVVHIEERILTDTKEEDRHCHLIAAKAGLVKQLIYSAGEARVEVNDYVKEGDLLVSGELTFQDAIKDQVCATGKVMAEVWYTTHVHVPLKYEVVSETGKRRWNFYLRKGSLRMAVFRPRITNYVDEEKHLFSIGPYEFSFAIQKEVTRKQQEYTEDEVMNLGMKEIDEKFALRLQEDEKILSKKVLKKVQNDSTMDIEVFVSVLEDISKQENF